jgi:alcohol dehydrogenase, propanol-preferring
MKAMVLSKPAAIADAPLKGSELPAPRPKKGEVLIDIAVCGLCHTDLHIVEGEITPPAYPLIPGHQIIGRVSKLGAGAARFRVGDRVGVPWLNHTCGRCPYCRNTQENLCEAAVFTGFSAPGGYAEKIAVPADFTYPIPGTIPDEELAPLLCGGIIGYRALKLSGLQSGETVGLVGFGASAHLALQIARHWCCPVMVFTRGEEHRRLALSLGAFYAGPIEAAPPRQAEKILFFAPAGKLLPPALGHLKKGGTLVSAAIYLDQVPPLDYQKHLYFEKTIRSVTASTRRDAEELLRLAEIIPLRSKVEVFPLAQANEALLALKESKIRGAAGVLNCRP